MGSRKPNSIPITNEVIIGRVYKIYNIVDEKVYIGSTVKSLVQRLGNHIYDYNINTNMRLYHHMRLIGLQNFRMELLEWKQVDKLNELRQLEQKWIDRENRDNLLNLSNPSPKYKEIIQIVQPIIEELVEKVFAIKLDTINEKK